MSRLYGLGRDGIADGAGIGSLSRDLHALLLRKSAAKPQTNILKTLNTMQREMSACMSHIPTNGASAHDVCSSDGSISIAITAVVMSIIARVRRISRQRTA